MKSTITCPGCGHRKADDMPVDACVRFYLCEKCEMLIRPRPGDCCVFCSYGNVKCPTKQAEQSDGDGAQA